MRTFIGGDGSDTTAAVMAYMASAKQLRLADLYLIGEQEDPNAIWLTNWESPLAWPVWGTFQPAKITRDKITSQIGLEVASLKPEWSPKLTAFGSSIATANPYQKGQLGVYDNWRFRLWRCVMPIPGDANTYGACELFGGRIADTFIERGAIKFQVNSFLDVVNQPVPPNVVEAANTVAGFMGNTPVLADGETNVPTFTVVAPSSTNLILGDCIQPTAHKIYGLNKFILGFMMFRAGSSLAGFWSPIAANQSYNAGGGHYYNQFQTFAEFPWAPTPGDTFYVSTQWPVDFASATAGQFKGFPFVPDPIAAA